jgi:zinc transporter, ZIP family
MKAMVEFFKGINPVGQAFIAALFTWGLTAVGASLVFFVKKTNQRFMDSMLAFAGGVMIAASYWSLLATSIELAEKGNVPSWIPAVTGFLLGGLFLLSVDKLLSIIDTKKYLREIKNQKAKNRTTLLLFSMTLHNIPEGLAVGVAFGSLSSSMDATTISGAAALALGIGIQNFPEGTAVSMPLHRDGMSKMKSFMFGQFSGIVEPIAAVIGAMAVIAIQSILPYALSFAAGAMIFVVAKEIIPGSQEEGHVNLASVSLMLGFAVMMTLDVALG